MSSAVPAWVGNQHVRWEGGDTSVVSDPSTGDVIGHVAHADRDQVDEVIMAARAAWPDWSAETPARRARVMFRYRDLLEAHAEELANLISQENGKVLEDARGDIGRGIEVVEFACGVPHLLKDEASRAVGTNVDCVVTRNPLGVCVGITPFNFPAMVPLWMFPLAIACGNTFVLKPSEKVPLTAIRLAELAAEAGLPSGVLNVVHGGRETAEALLDHPEVASISFVGSTPAARMVYARAAENGKRVQALGGAKNHMVVLEDADLDGAVNAAVGAAFGSAGQRCMAISCVVAVGDAGDEFVDRLSAAAGKVVVGPGRNDGSEMGPLITRAQRDRVSAYVDRSIEQGATIALDGRSIDDAGDGFFLGPTIVDHVTADMDVYQDEVFGPVLAVVRVDTLREAIQLVNDNPYGNGAAIFTASGPAGHEFTTQVQAGMVGVNAAIPVPVAYHSFGGWKASLFGDSSVHGSEGVRFYTKPKVVTLRWPTRSDRGLDVGMPRAGH